MQEGGRRRCVLAAIAMDLTFTALGWAPGHDTDLRTQIMDSSLNDTFRLNLPFGARAAHLFYVGGTNPMNHGHSVHGDGHDKASAPHDHAAHQGA